MELVPIFINEQFEGLHSVRYELGRADEFEKLFEDWSDANTVTSYLLFNKQYLHDEYFDNLTDEDLIKRIDELAIQIAEEAEAIEKYFLKLEQEFQNGNNSLDDVFEPLSRDIPNEQAMRDSKGKVDVTYPILRIYGIRVSAKTYIITGGAIKITKEMDKHPDTKEQLRRFELVKQFLSDNNIHTEQDIYKLLYERQTEEDNK